MRRVITSRELALDYRYSMVNQGPGYTGVGSFYAKQMMTPMGDGRQTTAGPHLKQQADGTYEFTPERHALHNQIVQKYLGQSQSQQNPIFTVLGGGPGSGKATVRKQVLNSGSSGENPVVVDSDDIKKDIPEYNQMVAQGNPDASTLSHYESSYLADRVQKAAFANKMNLVHDSVGDGNLQHLINTIHKAKNQGYTVNGEYSTVDTPTAQQRAVQRGQESGRVVPPTLISDLHRGVSQILPQVSHEFNSLNLWHNGTWTPKKVYSSNNGQEQIHDPQEYQNFLNKANEA